MRKFIISISFISILVFMVYKIYSNNNKDLIKVDLVKDQSINSEINSKEYWDQRFGSRDWEKNFGAEQTLHFYTLLVNGMPEEVQQEFNDKHYTIMDFGCAQGEGTDYLAKVLDKTSVTGVDFSCEAIEIANARNSKAKYVCKNLLSSEADDFKQIFDVVISSNTLEHFYNPWEVLSTLSTKAKKYMVILVPFDQKNIPDGEHFYSFNYNNIPTKINGFSLVFKKLIYPDPKYWADKQIILLYKKD